METNKLVEETLQYLQEDDNAAIVSWREFLVDVIDVVTDTNLADDIMIRMITELSTLRGILGKLTV